MYIALGVDLRKEHIALVFYVTIVLADQHITSWLCTQDDKYVMTALSVDHPECPPLEGVPRAQVSRSPQSNQVWDMSSCNPIVTIQTFSKGRVDSCGPVVV